MADQELVEILTQMREILTRAEASHVVEMIDDIAALLDRDPTAAARELVGWRFWRNATDLGIESRYMVPIKPMPPHDAEKDALDFEMLQCRLIDVILRLGYARSWRDRRQMRSLKRMAERGIRHFAK